MDPRCFVPDDATLIGRLRRDYMPESALDFVDTLVSYMATKVWRMMFPAIAIILDMVAVAQNTALWKEYRDGSWGGSGYAALAGYDDYTTNVDQYRLQAGIDEVKPSMHRAKHRPAQHGHEFEDEADEIHAAAMGTINTKSGINLHWKFPHMHVSPDLLVEYPAGVLPPNKYALKDRPRGGGEIKCFQRWGRYTTPSGRMTMPVGYWLQVINQMDCMCWDWVDWIKHIRCRNLDADGQPLPLGNNKYLVAETSMMRVYANPKAAKQIAVMLEAHKMALRKKQEPALKMAGRGTALKFEDAVILPMRTVKFILTVPEGENPVGPDGLLNGVVHREIQDRYDQKPLRVSTDALHEGSDDVIEELDSVPEPPQYPTLEEVRHPLLRELMQKSPSTPLHEHVYRIATLDADLLKEYAPELYEQRHGPNAVSVVHSHGGA